MGGDPRAVWEGEGARAYARGRPSPPADLIAPLIAEMGIDRRHAVMDLGAGTGKFTRSIAPLVARTVAVEPSAAMLAVLKNDLPDVDARLGSAEAIPVRDGEVDAVFVADAFHWFETRRALAEIGRVLRPAGMLVLVWHHQSWWNPQVSPWVAAFEERLRPYWQASIEIAGEHPNTTKSWREVLDGYELFGSIASRTVDFVDVLDAEAFLGLVRSYGFLNALTAADRDTALDLVADLIRPLRQLELPYTTELQFIALASAGA